MHGIATFALLDLALKTTKMSQDTPLSGALFTAQTLSEALPYIQRYDRKTVVIKYGGHAMADMSLAAAFAKDVVLLKHLGVNPVVVHGGGPQIGRMLEKLGVQTRFEDGLRVTCEDTMEVVEMVLAGSINKTIVRAISAAGGKAVGLSGADAQMITARKARKRARTLTAISKKRSIWGLLANQQRSIRPLLTFC